MSKHVIKIKDGVTFEYTDDEIAESTVGSQGAKQAISDVTEFGQIKKEKLKLEVSHSRYPGKRWVRRGYSEALDKEIGRSRKVDR